MLSRDSQGQPWFACKYEEASSLLCDVKPTFVALIWKKRTECTCHISLYHYNETPGLAGVHLKMRKVRHTAYIYCVERAASKGSR